MDINIFLLGLCSSRTPVAWDIETNSLSPYYSDTYIYSWSFYNGEGLSTAFLDTPLIRKMLIQFMESRVGKICHNIKFEYKWCEEKLGVQMKGELYDTQLGAHIQHNTQRSGLKPLTEKYFGIGDYDSIIKSFLKAKKGSYKNTIEDAPLTSLLKYNALDSLFTYMLWKLQVDKMKDSYPFKLFMDGIQTLIKMSRNGFLVDTEYCNKMWGMLAIDSNELIQKMKDDEVGKLWAAIYGLDTNFHSNAQLSHILYDELKQVATVFTKSGAPSVDKNVLQSVDKPFFKLLSEYKQVEDVRTLLIDGIAGNADANGLIHGSFNLHSTKSYRSSASEPNMQNMPVRHPVNGKIIRDAFYPHKGQQIVEVDYSGLEVSVAAFHHHDPVMIEYLIDDSKDMHRDTAMEIFMLKKDEVTKDIRQCVKGGFVFSQFYGSYYVECAKDLWKSANEFNLIDHLKRNGIFTYDKFEQHVQLVEYRFWKEKFKVYDKWKEEQWKLYKANGCIESLIGFKYVGDMSKNQVINYPTQGLASHILLWGLIEIDKYLTRGKFKTKIVNQIHDSVVFSMEPSELNRLLPVIKRIMTKNTAKRFSCINVPLRISIEVAGIDESWAKKKEIEL